MHPISLWLTLGGCGLKAVLPSGPVVSDKALAAFEHIQASPVQYTSTPGIQMPILPVTAFGLTYAVDVVLVSQHPDWDMHEYARLDLPDRSIWIAKDSDHSGRQTIVADVPDLITWLPEIPAPRIEAPLTVHDASDGAHIDVSIAYTNPKGQYTEVRAKGTLPDRPPKKRNGNTMGHSRDAVAAVLDLERFGSDLQAEISIDGETQTIDRVLGLVPFRFLLRQTQAGIAVASYRQTSSADGFVVERPIPGQEDWPTSGSETWSWDGTVASSSNGILSYEYRFVEGGLAEVTVQQVGQAQPSFQLRFQPALPDLRRTFDGTAASRFVMSVNGQAGHGEGEVSVVWDDSRHAVLTITPTAPHWLADRPMISTVSIREEGGVDVRTQRIHLQK